MQHEPAVQRCGPATMRTPPLTVCPACGSEHLLDGLRLVATDGRDVQVVLDGHPSIHGPVHARVCADCGRLELLVEHAHRLWQAAQREG